MGNSGEHGQALISMTASLLALVAVAGLGVDVVLGLIVRSQLQSAVDGAVLAAARSDADQRSAVAAQVFAANFPAGHLLTSARSAGPLSTNGNTYTMTATANLPTFFMRVLGYSSLTVNAAASATHVPAEDPVEMVAIDEDAIDNSTPSIVSISNQPTRCGSSSASRCVNDDIANPYVRTLLFTRGRNILPYAGLTLPTGQVGDEGLFRFTRPDPQLSNQNGTTFTIAQLVASTGPAGNENNLDKLDDVIPMGTTEIQAMLGKKFCALVFDSDISFDSSKHEASLKGATMGLTAFTVTAVAGSGYGSNLPSITVSLMSSTEATTACAQAKAYGNMGSSGAGAGSGASVVYRPE